MVTSRDVVYLDSVVIVDTNPFQKGPLMTDMMNLHTLVEKSADVDLLREMIGFAAERLIEMGWFRDRRCLW